MNRSELQLFSTCPQSSKHEPSSYLDRVAEVSQWSDRRGYTGMLIYADHSLVDPWLVAAEVLQRTDTLSPLLAVQPASMHPHSTAKMIASLSYLYSRRIHLNMIAGGFTGDLQAIGDRTPHDQRYARLQEFTEIVLDLVGGSAVSRTSDWYHVDDLRLTPKVPEELRPGLLMSGSSPASLATARALGATAVQYPQPPGEERSVPVDLDTGIRIGIIARERSEDAWLAAHERFPPNRTGQILHEMAMDRSDSHWHATLSTLAEQSSEEGNPYWLEPFENYHTFCPYLVGSHEQVAAEIRSYWDDGHRTIILDIPVAEEELDHIDAVLAHAETLDTRMVHQ